ncbi:L-histidine N(alpha)-methyltransferase [Methylobacterium komagatae]|uniref:L-histidine N(Alpha)-methyltransferase n=1 Tax=Methylobacterium komagatae TaxID=374425 RepID=A0ABW2BK99_9HYPH
MSDPAFLADVLAGFSQTPKHLPGKYLWDEAGSILFDRICGSPDYYPTQCEMALLSRVAPAIANRIGPRATIVEFGSGASRKIRVLLDTLHDPARYIAIDISGEYLEASLRTLAGDYPDIAMVAVRADYSRRVDLPVGRGEGLVLGFFPGTSIGNFAPEEATAFLARARDTLGPSYFLVGADTTQDEDRLVSVYGGCGGLMEALHLNILSRINRELGADIQLDAFRHEARVLHEPFRVEAHLVAKQATTFHLGGREFAFTAGESVRTDTSHKYPAEAFRALAGKAGWTAEESFVDSAGFALHLLRC